LLFFWTVFFHDFFSKVMQYISHFSAGESESDDGVSVISDSGPEEEEEEVVVARAESACEEQELLELGEKGEAQYKHQPNPQLNLLLNAILVVAFASVSGLAVGHFLGVNIKHLGMELELIGVLQVCKRSALRPRWPQWPGSNLIP
jgi:hypothetical protein